MPDNDPLDLDELKAEYERFQPFDVDEFVCQHLKLRQKKRLPNGGYKWLLEVCPFNRDHTRCAALLQSVTGNVGFKCFHDSCKDKTWADVRALFDPPDKSATA